MRVFIIIVFLSIGSSVYCQDSMQVLRQTLYQDLDITVVETDSSQFLITAAGNRGYFLRNDSAALYNDTAYLSSFYRLDKSKQSIHNIPVYGDSLYLYFASGNTFVLDKRRYAILGKIERDTMRYTQTGIEKPFDFALYEILEDSIRWVSDLDIGFPVTVSNLVVLPNLRGNFTILFNLSYLVNFQVNLWRLVEFDTLGSKVATSDTLFTQALTKRLVQRRTDSSYFLVESNFSKIHKINASLQYIDTYTVRYPQTAGYFVTANQFPSIVDSLLYFVHFKPSHSADTSYLGVIYLEGDTVALWTIRTPVSANNQVHMGYFNYSDAVNTKTYAYTNPRCYTVACQADCTNHVYIRHYDKNDNLAWSKTLGGDASYMIGSITNTSDGGVLGTLLRYDTLINNYGDFDTYYFYLDSNGNFISDYLPLATSIMPPDLKEEKLVLYPNPTNYELTLVNESIIAKAESLSILNLLGQNVHFQPFQKTIDVSSLPTGIYFYLLRLNNGLVLCEKFYKE